MSGKTSTGKIYAGTSGWAYPSWKPKFYPAKLASAKFLGYYATRLNSVEVNYTFRTEVTAKLLAAWIAATPADFKFAVKAHQTITHIRRLRAAATQTSKFLVSLEPLRDAGKLGPILFQLPPFLKCDIALLEEFLATLSAPYARRDGISPPFVVCGRCLRAIGSRECRVVRGRKRKA